MSRRAPSSHSATTEEAQHLVAQSWPFVYLCIVSSPTSGQCGQGSSALLPTPTALSLPGRDLTTVFVEVPQLSLVGKLNGLWDVNRVQTERRPHRHDSHPTTPSCPAQTVEDGLSCDHLSTGCKKAVACKYERRVQEVVLMLMCSQGLLKFDG